MAKLGHFARLSAADRAAVLRLCATATRRYRAKDDVVRQGEPSRVVRVMVDGWACRYKDLEDGRRQVVGLLVPGDLCDPDAFVLRATDHSIAALTPITVAQLTREAFEAATEGRPRLLEALRWDGLVTAAIGREWLVGLGQRSAHERILHLFCELFWRLRAAGRADGMSCEFPLTQVTIADIAGLSTVHVSRTVQAVREEGLVELKNRTLAIRDLPALMDACLFDPAYLHLDREGRHLDANEDEA